MKSSGGGFPEIWILVIIIVVSIGSWALAKKYREEYGTTEMSRFRGGGLFLGFCFLLVGTAFMCQPVVEQGRAPSMDTLAEGAIAVLIGTGLSLVCCLGILRRYSGRAAVAMIFRLFVVGVSVYMMVSWILTAVFMWLFSKLFPRRRYIIVED